MKRFREFIKTSNYAKSFALIALCLGVNLLLSFIARAVNYEYAPLYLDNIGTIFAAMLGGTLPGVIVGFATNAINSIFTSELTMYYGTISVIIALIVRYLFVNGYFKTIWKRVASSLIIALVSGLLGAVLTWLIYGFDFGSEISAPLAQKLASDWRIYPIASQFASEIFINILDKFISVFAACLAFKLCPKRIKSAFGYREKEAERISVFKKLKSFNNSLPGIVVRTMLLFEVILCTLSTVICYFMYQNTNVSKYASTCHSATELAINVINPELIESFVEERQSIFDEYVEDLPAVCSWDPQSYPDYFTEYYDFAHSKYSDEYIVTERRLEEIASAFPNLKYFYVYKVEEDGCHIVFDVDHEQYATKSEFGESFQNQKSALLNGENIDIMITDDEYGWLLSYFNPLRDSDGYCYAYVCADVSMNQLKIDQLIFVVKTVSVLIGASIIVLVIVLNIFSHGIVKPIKKISAAASDFAFDTDNKQNNSKNRIMALDIKSCDEIEELYDSLKKLAGDSTDYIEKIKSDAEAMSRLQEGIIVDFANMVENRDKNTGDHIKKTSMYVKMIAEELRNEGKYADILTDEFIAKIVRSAPLHDIGKIRISDLILNKPGKLTEEEFEIMKTHANAGAEILTNAMVNVEDKDYLNEAINMAHYHHEWWNGNGYPEGISGEDIPLSARIMAVADVFDALVSKRSYKAPFPFDKSVDIIKEESGTHFDPSVAEAFLKISEQVR